MLARRAAATDDPGEARPYFLAIFGFLALAAIAISAYAQIQGGRINDVVNRQRTSEFQECTIRNSDSQRINTLFDGQIAFVKQSTTLTAAQKSERITFYNSIRFHLADCIKP